MITVIALTVSGNSVSVKLSNGKHLHGKTCDCRRGCQFTWDVKNTGEIVGKEFESEREIESYLAQEY